MRGASNGKKEIEKKEKGREGEEEGQHLWCGQIGKTYDTGQGNRLSGHLLLYNSGYWLGLYSNGEGGESCYKHSRSYKFYLKKKSLCFVENSRSANTKRNWGTIAVDPDRHVESEW